MIFNKDKYRGDLNDKITSTAKKEFPPPQKCVPFCRLYIRAVWMYTILSTMWGKSCPSMTCHIIRTDSLSGILVVETFGRVQNTETSCCFCDIRPNTKHCDKSNRAAFAFYDLVNNESYYFYFTSWNYNCDKVGVGGEGELRGSWELVMVVGWWWYERIAVTVRLRLR